MVLKIICNLALESTIWSVANTQTIQIIVLAASIQIQEAQHLAEASTISIMGKVISLRECRTQTIFIITAAIVTLNRTHSHHPPLEIRFTCTKLWRILILKHRTRRVRVAKSVVIIRLPLISTPCTNPNTCLWPHSKVVEKAKLASTIWWSIKEILVMQTCLCISNKWVIRCIWWISTNRWMVRWLVVWE